MTGEGLGALWNRYRQGEITAWQAGRAFVEKVEKEHGAQPLRKLRDLAKEVGEFADGVKMAVDAVEEERGWKSGADKPAGPL